MIENWKPVDGWERYEISDCGRLRKANNHDFIYSMRQNTNGRVQYSLQKKGVRKGYQAHILVLEHFVGPRPDGLEARHLDGNHLNNHVSNLCWGTHTENMRDRVTHGTNISGKQRILTIEQARAIKQEHRDGASGHSLAKKYDVNAGSVWQIINNRSYQDA